MTKRVTSQSGNNRTIIVDAQSPKTKFVLFLNDAVNGSRVQKQSPLCSRMMLSRAAESRKIQEFKPVIKAKFASGHCCLSSTHQSREILYRGVGVYFWTLVVSGFPEKGGGGGGGIHL